MQSHLVTRSLPEIKTSVMNLPFKLAAPSTFQPSSQTHLITKVSIIDPFNLLQFTYNHSKSTAPLTKMNLKIKFQSVRLMKVLSTKEMAMEGLQE